MNLAISASICLVLLVNCTKYQEVQWSPKEGLTVVTAKNRELLCSSADILRAKVLADWNGENTTIWCDITPATFDRFCELNSGEILAVQMKGVTVATYEWQQRIYTGPPSFPIPEQRNPDGSWLSTTILNRVDLPPKP